MTADLLAAVWWDDANGVARVDWPAGSTCGAPEAKAATDAVIALGHGFVPILVDTRFMANITRPGREYFINDSGTISAIALWADSPVSRVLVNFFIGLQRTRVPIRNFTDVNSALNWLDDHRG